MRPRACCRRRTKTPVVGGSRNSAPQEGASTSTTSVTSGRLTRAPPNRRVSGRPPYDSASRSARLAPFRATPSSSSRTVARPVRWGIAIARLLVHLAWVRCLPRQRRVRRHAYSQIPALALPSGRRRPCAASFVRSPQTIQVLKFSAGLELAENVCQGMATKALAARPLVAPVSAQSAPCLLSERLELQRVGIAAVRSPSTKTSNATAPSRRKTMALGHRRR